MIKFNFFFRLYIKNIILFKKIYIHIFFNFMQNHIKKGFIIFLIVQKI